MANELRKKLAIVGMTGAVFVGGVFGLGGLASATTPDQPEAATPDSGAAVEGDEHVDTDGQMFDGFLAEDQELILKFETCIDDGLYQLPDDDEEWTEENEQQIDALFEECEVILDDLSFPAGQWLEGDGHWEEEDWEDRDREAFYDELSDEDEAVFEEFETCVGAVEAELPENDADWTDQNFEQLESRFEACDSILDDLSEDLGFFIIDAEHFEGCDDLLDEVLEGSALEDSAL